MWPPCYQLVTKKREPTAFTPDISAACSVARGEFMPPVLHVRLVRADGHSTMMTTKTTDRLSQPIDSPTDQGLSISPQSTRNLGNDFDLRYALHHYTEVSKS